MKYLSNFNINSENEIYDALKNRKNKSLPKETLKNPNYLKKTAIGVGIGALGYLGYKGYQRYKRKNPEGIQIGDDTDRKVLSSIGNGAKWAVGATVSGKALDYGRRGLGYHYANWKLKKPNNLNAGQLDSYKKVLDNKGVLGEVKRNYNYLSGVGNVGDKASKFLSTRKGKILATSGVGLLGAGLYGYNKAKQYYLI